MADPSHASHASHPSHADPSAGGARPSTTEEEESSPLPVGPRVDGDGDGKGAPNGGDGGGAVTRPAPTPPADTTEVLGRIAAHVGERFQADQQIRSFGEFLEDVRGDPYLYTRSASEYVRDMFDHYGTRRVPGIGGQPVTRYNLFDAPFGEHRSGVQGQEEVQAAVYRHLVAFCEKGRSDKLLMLHGPNGSSKSTLVELIMLGLQHYSRRPEGVLYTINWLFSDSFERDRLGFGQGDAERPDLKGSYAYLPPEEVTFQMPCELKDNPIFLVPKADRIRLVEEAYERLGKPPRLSDFVATGELCQKCREIYSGLLNSYQGDWARVVSHVRVERVLISKRYRRGAVTIEPQRNADGATRALNLEKNFQIPPVLAHSNLFEPFGDLIDANGGVVEYSDFFKRPLELHKYLLTTCEKNTISLPSYMAYLNMVMFATANEKHLSAFKRDPDFPAFKARIELIKAPYLLETSKEQKIYEDHIRAICCDKHVAPHTARLAGLWAVLTRLKRPKSKHYTSDLGAIVARLTPLQKAQLYDGGGAPDELKENERRELTANIDRIVREFADVEEEFEGLIDAAYEGRRGASPREIMTLINEAASYEEFRCLSPLAVLKSIRKLYRDRSVYDFLRLEPDNGYGDIERLTDDCEEAYLGWIVEEVNDSMDMVEEKEYQRLFEDYFLHVKAFNRGEKIPNRQTGELQDPNEELMQEVESVIGVKERPEAFRRSLIERIAAWAISHSNAKLEYAKLFGDILKALRTSYYKKREQAVETITQNILKFGTEDARDLSPSERRVVLKALARLKIKSGYCMHCAKEVLAYVLKNRPSMKA